MKATHATLDNGHDLFIIEVPIGGRVPATGKDLFKPLIEECRSAYGAEGGKKARWEHKVFEAGAGALVPWAWKKKSWAGKGAIWAMLFLTFYDSADGVMFKLANPQLFET